jgi:hypothetical protein
MSRFAVWILMFFLPQIAMGQNSDFRTFRGHEDAFQLEAKIVDLGENFLNVETRDGTLRKLMFRELSRKDLLFVITKMVEAQAEPDAQLSKLTRDYKNAIRGYYREHAKTSRISNERERTEKLAEIHQPITDLNGKEVKIHAELISVKSDGNIVLNIEPFYSKFRATGQRKNTFIYQGGFRNSELDTMKAGDKFIVRAELFLYFYQHHNQTNIPVKPGRSLTLVSGKTRIQSDSKKAYYVFDIRNIAVERLQD